MQERKKAAARGREFWLALTEKYHIDMTQYVIVLPGTNREYNRPAIEYLPLFLKKRGIQKAYVLTCDDWVVQQLGRANAEEDQVCVLEYSKAELGDLVQFYCLYEFAPNIIIGSLSEPSGRMGDRLVGIKNLTADEVFAGICYSLVD